MSTSPGKGGAARHLKFLIRTLPYQGAHIAATFSLPSFYETFQDGAVVGDHLEALQTQVAAFTAAVKS